MDTPQSTSLEKVSVFQLFILLLSIVVLAALIVDTVAPVSPEVSTILQLLDTAVCALFFVDFLNRFYRAESKAVFMRWGWIDLLASIPNIDVLRVGRLVRVLRIIRLLRGVRTGQRIVSLVLQNKPRSALASVGLITLLLIIFSSIAILIAETGTSANIKTAEDAVWWSVTTITTVGYGDMFPTSTEGRIIAMVLMISGVGLFGTLSGLVASTFLGQREQPPSETQQLLARLEKLTKVIEELNRHNSAG